MVLFLMRAYDELKDFSLDIELGRAGDPRYRDRPIVRGDVREADIRLVRNFLVAALLVANIALLEPLAIGCFAVLFFVLWLSSRWFFIAEHRRSLMVAFLTHNPITAVVGLYILGVFGADFDFTKLHGGFAALLIVGMWMPVAAWETSRKVRVPQEETDYETYSKVFGARAAGIVPASFVVVATTVFVAIGHRVGLPIWYFLILAAGALVPIAACSRFVLKPTSKSSKLQSSTEVFAAVADLGLVVAIVASYGVRF
jgi:4-hydroxybenzoate polyprenyltransferase